jgi:hypothetical protein
VCSRWRRDRDFDDIVSEAVLGTLSCDDARLLRRRMTCKAIDYLRHRDGRSWWRQPLPLTVEPSTQPSERTELIVGNDREAQIVDMLLAGHLQREVAEHLGVSEPRITQMLGTIRRRNGS